jgi:hypothetical protein
MHIVENADEKLTGLLFALANEYNDADQHYSQEELDFFYARRGEFFADDKNGYTVEDAHEKTRREIILMDYILLFHQVHLKILMRGLGDCFLDELALFYKKLKQNPTFYSFVSHKKTVRSLSLKTFPY